MESNHTQGHRLLYGSVIPSTQLVSPSAKSMYVSAEIRYNSWRKFLQIMTWANNLKTGDLKAKLPLDLNLEDWFPQEIIRSNWDLDIVLMQYVVAFKPVKWLYGYQGVCCHRNFEEWNMSCCKWKALFATYSMSILSDQFTWFLLQEQIMDKSGCMNGWTATTLTTTTSKQVESRDSRDSMVVFEEVQTRLTSRDLIGNRKIKEVGVI